MVGHVVVALGLKVGMNIRLLGKPILDGIHVLRVRQVVEENLGVLLMDALIFQEVLNLNQIHAHLDHLLDEGLFALREEVLLILVAPNGPLLRKLLLDALLAGLVGWIRHNALFLEEVEKLAWDLLESLLGELGWIVPVLTEWNELHDVSLHVLLVLLRVQRHLIRVQDVHTLEVIRADANDNDRDRQ